MKLGNYITVMNIFHIIVQKDPEICSSDWNPYTYPLLFKNDIFPFRDTTIFAPLTPFLPYYVSFLLVFYLFLPMFT